ncbi:MAG: DNA polymerase III subunit delta [Bacteroidota bacterium]
MLFKDIIGQEEVKRRLIQTVQENRVSHAQLFFGPEGSGKLALALAYSRYICCENRLPDDACGVCPSCVKFNKLVHPDIHFVYPIFSVKSGSKSLSTDFITDWRELFLDNPYFNVNDWLRKIGIENQQAIINTNDCNEIIKTLSLKSYESEYKIMIIWMVEKLHHAAAPKLLKILEEPPEKTLFILVAENTDQIIKTILSRTQLVKVPRLRDADIKDALKLKSETSEETLNYCVHHAEGNFNEALKQLIDNNQSESYFKTFSEWMRMCYAMDYIGMVKWVDDHSKIGRERMKQFFNYSTEMIRECIQLNCLRNDDVMLDAEEKSFAIKFSKFIHAGNCILIVEELNKAAFHIERNGNPKVVMMDLSLKFSNLLRM